jgi:hypothetical protein
MATGAGVLWLPAGETTVSGCSFACLLVMRGTATAAAWVFAALPMEASSPGHVCHAFANAVLKLTAGESAGNTAVASEAALFGDVDAIRTQLLVQVAGHNYPLRSRIVYRRKMLISHDLWNG